MKLFKTLLLLALIPGACFAQSKRRLSSITDYTRSAGISLSLPWVNGYAYHDYEYSRSDTKGGFAGFGLGAFYKKPNTMYSFHIAATADAPVPLGPVDYGKSGTRSMLGTQYIEALYHHSIYKRLWGIAGVNWVNYRYHFVDYDFDFNYTRHNAAVGVTGGLEYISKKSFAAALLYRPAIIAFQKEQYWHMITLDLRFDLPVWKK